MYFVKKFKYHILSFKIQIHIEVTNLLPGRLHMKGIWYL